MTLSHAMFPRAGDPADEPIRKLPAPVTCRMLGSSRQAYQERVEPVTDRDRVDAHLVTAAIDIHHDDPESGYRFMTDELAGCLRCCACRRRSKTEQFRW